MLLVGNNCDLDDNDENKVVKTKIAEVSFPSSYYKLRQYDLQYFFRRQIGNIHKPNVKNTPKISIKKIDYFQEKYISKIWQERKNTKMEK